MDLPGPTSCHLLGILPWWSLVTTAVLAGLKLKQAFILLEPFLE